MQRLKYYCFLFVGIFLGQTGWSQTPQQIFDAANQFYFQKKFDSAAADYQQLINEGYENSSLFFNAGNAYYKINQLGNAVYYYEKALRQSPNDAAIRHNLQLANQQVTENMQDMPALFFQNWWLSFIHWQSLNTWAIGIMIFIWLTLLFFVLMKLYDVRPQLTRWMMIVSIFLLLICLVAATGNYLQINNHDDAIVMKQEVPLKSAPDGNSPDLLNIHEGLKVTVLDTAAGWDKIELKNGKTGWIAASAIKSL